MVLFESRTGDTVSASGRGRTRDTVLTRGLVRAVVELADRAVVAGLSHTQGLVLALVAPRAAFGATLGEITGHACGTDDQA